MSSSTRTTRTKRANALDTLTVALVGRQSRSDDGSLSVPDQHDTMISDVERREWVVGNRYSETDVSGQRPLSRRTGLLRAVEDVEQGRAQVVMVAYFDRLCRSLKTQIEVVDRVEAAGGIIQVAYGSTISHATPTDRLTSTMLGAVAEYVALTAGERTIVSKQRNIDKGVPPFPKITPAYVRRADGTLEPHPVNAPLIREAIRMRVAKSPASFVQLAKWLNEQPLVKIDDDGNETPIKITPSGVESMLGSKLLIGEIHFGDFTPNQHAGALWGGTIIDRATFRKMQSLRATRGRYSKSERLLARQGVLVCKTCKSRMIVASTKSNGKTYHYYRCDNFECSARAMVACDVAEQTVVDATIELTKSIEGRATNDAEIEAARVEREAAQAKLTRAIDTLLGLESESASRNVLDELSADLDTKRERHERLLAMTTPELTVTTAHDWDRFTLDERREIIGIVIDRAVVSPGRGPGRVRVIARSA